MYISCLMNSAGAIWCLRWGHPLSCYDAIYVVGPPGGTRFTSGFKNYPIIRDLFCLLIFLISASNRFCTKNVTETSSFSIHFFHHTRISFLHAMTVCALMYRIIWLYNVCILTLFILYTHWYFSFSTYNCYNSAYSLPVLIESWFLTSSHPSYRNHCHYPVAAL